MFLVGQNEKFCIIVISKNAISKQPRDKDK